MKNHTRYRYLLFLGFLFLVSACEVKTGVDADTSAPDRFAGKTKITGPKVNGAWQTPCLSDGTYTSTRMTLSFSGNKFQRKTDKFKDQYCQTLSDSDKFSGDYIFSSKYKDGSFNINYAIDLKNGWTQYLEEKLFVDKDVLYTSQYVPGEDAPLYRDRPMKLNGWTPKTCENYAGEYKSQDENLTILQVGCESMSINSNIYLPDGVERYYRNGQMKVSFFKELFRREYRNYSQESIMEQWSFQTRPCNIVNPDQSRYLTKEVWINGSYSYNDCSYYNRIK